MSADRRSGAGARRRVSRRGFVRAAAVAGGAATLGAGTASAHRFGDDGDASAGGGDHDHSDPNQHRRAEGTELLDYHSLGGAGPSSESGRPDEPHYGAITEIRAVGDYAYVGIFSSDDPTNDRGMAILDVSEFNGARTLSELRDAELRVRSFVRNDNPASAVMDVKVSDDGDYVFLSKQPYTALFEETDPTPGVEGESASPSAGAVVAVDVSDPDAPRVVGSYDGWTTGVHNACYHRIDGGEYVFAVKDLNDGTAGLYVLEFDRTTGALVPVNKWTPDGNLADGDLDGGLAYVHDIVVQDDPRTGRPYGYLSYWDAGLRVLDLSDPTDVEEIGRFEMGAAHYAEPAPALTRDKRIVVAGQETPSRADGTTGTIHLLDADGLDDGYDGSPNLAELDVWEWRSEATFDDFTLSPHNFDVAAGGWVHLAHYHGGVRYLRIDRTGDRWELDEEGYYLPHRDVPEESKMEGLNTAAPFTWAAVERGGVTFASDINSGVYAIRHEHVPFETGRRADVIAEREDDGSAFVAGQTNRVDVAVAADRPVRVRDRLPSEWTVVGGGVSTETAGGTTRVEFDRPVRGDTLTYFAEAPSGFDASRRYTFGPVEYSLDGGETWTPAPETTEENVVLGANSGALGAVGIAGTGGALYRFRNAARRLVGRIREHGNE
ncbi:LVIVD repeat-containing protein [Halegenticoccus soli]|uniref:LVIVD repeat-containing protein n=1 Tax=Halegenticoccus soli TaxID=1985678 RepID=UPI00117A37FD|nr:hypothetical protein [Halegenticoccus soli]